MSTTYALAPRRPLERSTRSKILMRNLASLAARSFSIAVYDLRGPASVYNLTAVYDLRMWKRGFLILKCFYNYFDWCERTGLLFTKILITQILTGVHMVLTSSTLRTPNKQTYPWIIHEDWGIPARPHINPLGLTTASRFYFTVFGLALHQPFLFVHEPPYRSITPPPPPKSWQNTQGNWCPKLSPALFLEILLIVFSSTNCCFVFFWTVATPWLASSQELPSWNCFFFLLYKIWW